MAFKSTQRKITQAEKWFLSDEKFDSLIPAPYRDISYKHWTPLDVAKKAAQFLAEGSQNPFLLDIGAGLGKFCATAAYFTKAKITGIEQRENLVAIGNGILQTLGLENVEILHENLSKFDMSKFTGIYFFNAFYENLDQTSVQVDSTIEFSSSLFRYYSDLFYKKLKAQPTYTRLATYHTNNGYIPDEYTVLETHFAGQLKFWIKYE